MSRAVRRSRSHILMVALAIALLGVLLPVIPGSPLAHRDASAHGGHTGPPDQNGVYAYCNVDVMRDNPGSASQISPSAYFSCQYGAVTKAIRNVNINWASDDISPYGSVIGVSSDYCTNGFPSGMTGFCDINQGGLFRESVIFTGADAPTTPWTHLTLSNCLVSFTDESPTVNHPCIVTLISQASVISPPFPTHWWTGGLDGNSVPLGQVLGAGSDEDAIDPTHSVGEPVNSLTGNFYTSMVDAYLPGFGQPFKFRRSYNSADSTVGPMGTGWTFSYGAHLVLGPGQDITYFSPKGKQLAYAWHDDGQTSGFTAGQGVLATLVKNANGTYTLTRKNGYVMKFDSAGKLTSMLDRNQNTITLGYTSGNLSTITDTAGRVINVTINGNGRLTLLSLPDGRSVSYTYTSNNLMTVTDLLGNTWNYTYDGNHHLLTVADPRPKTTVTNVYTNGRVTQQTDGEGNSSSFGWDGVTNTATFTDAEGNVWTDKYDHNRLLYSQDPNAKKTEYTYDGTWKPATVKVPQNGTGNDRIYQYTYDDRANVLTTTDPLGHTTTTTYNALNEPLTITDPLQNVTTYTYDARGNVTSIAQPEGATTTFSPDATTGQLNSVTDPNGKVTTYVYGAKGNLTKVTDAIGNVTKLAYDSGGRLTTKTDAKLHDWVYTYNNGNQLLTAKDPLNHTTTYTYSKIGQVKTITDAMASANVVTYNYDGNGHLLNVKDTGGNTVASYTYFKTGQLKTATDALGNVTTNTLYNTGQIHTVKDALNQIWSYDYRDDGSLKQVTLPSTDTITYAYDDAGRLLSVNYSNANTPDLGFGYDADDRVTSMSDGAGSVSYAYDHLNRLTSATRGSDVFSYTYYAGSQMHTRTYPDGTLITYGYNNDEQVNAIAADGATTSYAYDVNGNLDTTTLGNGLTTKYTYDNANRLTNVANKNGSTVVSNFAITRDNVGNPTQVVGPSGTTNYTYDGFYRLTKACTPSCTGGSPSGIGYTYDQAGNRLTHVVYGATNTTTTYKYNADNQLCWSVQGSSSNACTSPPAGATSYSYDVNGHQTAAGSRTFSYDSAGRVLSTTQSGTTQSYTYDAGGNMLTRSLGGTLQNSYLWDPNMGMPELAIERNGAGAVQRRYTYGAKGPGNLLSERAGSASYYYLPDGLGSVANLTSSTGALQWSYDYEGFGTTKTATKNDPNAPNQPMGFQGQYQDPTTNLYDMRAREYDTSTGRFLGLDPARVTAGGRMVSSYAYAFNQPTTLSDPSGMAPGVLGAFESWLCGGPCWDTLSDVVRNPVASWQAGPVAPKVIGFILIGVAVAVLAPEVFGVVAEEGGEAAVVGEAAAEEEGLAAASDGASSLLEDAVESCAANSFPASTPVRLAGGRFASISNVRIAERVASASPGQDGRIVSRRVIATYEHSSSRLYSLRFGTERLVSTGGHRFWAVGRGWVHVSDLRSGMRLRTLSGSVRLRSIRRLHRKQIVYDITVSGTHRFFVGRTALLAHNCGGLDALSQSGASLDPADAGGQLTRAGRAYAKASEVFGPTSGGPSAINAAGQDALDEILTNPGTVVTEMPGGNFAGGLRFTSPDGIGAVFDPGGTFQYFGGF